MTEKTLMKLQFYDRSNPSGVYDGKMWARQTDDGLLLAWYDSRPARPGRCLTIWKKILIV